MFFSGYDSLSTFPVHDTPGAFVIGICLMKWLKKPLGF
jgi:hypothetical protein